MIDRRDAMLRNHEGRRIAGGGRFDPLVIEGTRFDEGAIRAVLDPWLVGAQSPSAFDPARHRGLPNPLPAWGAAHAA